MVWTEEALNACLSSEEEQVVSLVAEVLRLRRGVQTHQKKSGHELCWLNDLELWKLIDSTVVYPHETLPVREEFLGQCRRFYDSRLSGTPYEEPKPQNTVDKKKK